MVSTFVCTSKMMVKLRFQAEFPVTFRARIIKFFFMNFQNMNLFPVLIFEQDNLLKGYWQQCRFKSRGACSNSLSLFRGCCGTPSTPAIKIITLFRYFIAISNNLCVTEKRIYRVFRQWRIILKPPETSENRPQRFLAGFRDFFLIIIFEKK